MDTIRRVQYSAARTSRFNGPRNEGLGEYLLSRAYEACSTKIAWKRVRYGPVSKAIFTLRASYANDESAPGPPIHPDVCFKQPQPYFDVLGEVMKPTSLVPICETSRIFCSNVSFMFTYKQIQDIVRSREFKSGVHSEYIVQVHLRFCLLDPKCPQGDMFPPNLSVETNGEIQGLNYTCTGKPGRALDITSLCRLSSTVPNRLEVSWKAGTRQDYCLAVYLVRKLSPDVLLQRLKQFGNRHADQTVALIKKKLSHDLDVSIAATSLNISLICPVSKTRMRTPCRSSTCNHLQCFDASNYLVMNEKKPRWVCPLCDKPAPFDKLLIDGYFVKVSRDAPDASEIEIHEDGSWDPITQNQDVHDICSPSTHEDGSWFPTVQDVHVISDSPVISFVSNFPTVPSTQPTNVIDLTGDNSDDELAPSKSKKRTNEDGRVDIQPNKKRRKAPGNNGATNGDTGDNITVTNQFNYREKNKKTSSKRKRNRMDTRYSSHSNVQSSNPSNNQFNDQCSYQFNDECNNHTNNPFSYQFNNQLYHPFNNQFHNQFNDQFHHQSNNQFHNPSNNQFLDPSNNQFHDPSNNQFHHQSNNQFNSDYDHPFNNSFQNPLSSQSINRFIDQFRYQSNSGWNRQFESGLSDQFTCRSNSRYSNWR